MIPNFIVVDGVNTTLANAVSTTSTAITLASSANLPTLGSGQMMPLILQSASNASANEVVYVTAISGASLTVVRGQEGTSAQNFAVGDLAFCGPTAGTVPLLGIQTLQPTASTSITPSYMTTIVQPNITAAATITIEPGTVVGQRVRVYGGAYAVTDQPNVTAGSPYFGLPDGSTVYSWIIPAGDTDNYIDHVWDGTNWRCTTAGQTVVAAATQDNAAVQLEQFTGTTISRNGETVYSASQTLTSANAGGVAIYIGTSPGTFTLPTSSAASPFTMPIVISNQGTAPLTVAPPSGDDLGSSVAVLQPGQTMAVTNDGSITWVMLWNMAGSTTPFTVGAAMQSNEATQLSQLFIGNRKAVFTSNGTWTVPSYISTIWVSGCAGGGGGGCGAGAVTGGNGGGAGQSVIKTPISVTGGHSLSISIGAGGGAGAAGNNPGGSGGNTVLTDSTSSTTLLTLSGGAGGGQGGAGSATQSAVNTIGTGYPAGGAGFIVSISDGNNESFGGAGGSGPFGGGGPMSTGTGGGTNQNGFGYGSGGGGGSGNAAGGNGAPGILIIEW